MDYLQQDELALVSGGESETSKSQYHYHTVSFTAPFSYNEIMAAVVPFSAAVSTMGGALLANKLSSFNGLTHHALVAGGGAAGFYLGTPVTAGFVGANLAYLNGLYTTMAG